MVIAGCVKINWIKKIKLNWFSIILIGLVFYPNNQTNLELVQDQTNLKKLILN